MISFKINLHLIFSPLKLKLFSIILILAVYGKGSFAQIPAYEIIRQNQNIDNKESKYSTIYATKCDNQGYLYLATNKGLFYYNGNTIVEFSNQQNSNNDETINLYQDKEGVIYSLPYYGKIHQIKSLHLKHNIIDFFNGDNYRAYHAFTDKHGNIIFQIEYFGKNYIGILSQNKKKHIIKVESQSHTHFMNSYFRDQLVDSSLIRELIKKRYNSTTQENRIIKDHFYVNKNVLYEMRNQQAYFVFDGNKMNLENSIIVDVHKDEYNGIYIAIYGNKHGLYYLQNNTLKTLYNETTVNSITRDKFGNLYFTDLAENLYKLENAYIEKLPIQPSNAMISIIPNHSQNELIINDNYTRLIFYNPKTMNSTSTKINENSNSILINSDTNAYYINEKYITNLQTPNEKKSIYDPKTNVFNLYLLNQLHILKQHFVFIYKYKIEEYDQVNHVLTRINNQFRVNYTHKINDSTLEIYTDKGIYRYITSNDISKRISKVDSIEILKSIQKKDTLYYITVDGYFKKSVLNSKSIKLNELSTLQNKNDISAMFFYNDYILLMKQKGMLIHNTSNQKIDEFDFKFLEPNSIVINTFILNENMYVATKSSVYKLNLAFLAKTKYNPEVILNNVIYNSTYLNNISDSIELNYTTKNFLVLKFDVLNYMFNLNNQLYYSISTQIENNTFLYPIRNYEIDIKNIPYDNYIISIFNNNQKIKTIYLNYIPKWYQTKLFYTILFMLFLSVCIGSIYWLFKKRYQHKKTELDNRNYQYQLESSAKLNQLKPHFIFNALAPLQTMILKSENELALEYLYKFSFLIRKMLNMSRDSLTTLENELDFLDQYLSLKRNERSNSFEFNIHCEININDAKKIKIPTLLIQPIIENSIVYCKDTIKVFIFNTSTNYLTCNVVDNGNGFDITELLMNKNKKNNALHIINERLEIYNKENGENFKINTFHENGFFVTSIKIPKNNFI